MEMSMGHATMHLALDIASTHDCMVWHSGVSRSRLSAHTDTATVDESERSQSLELGRELSP